jgi:hypothetical protein
MGESRKRIEVIGKEQVMGDPAWAGQVRKWEDE